jgi:tripartite ATP-independent transporter DctP family solute receptor
MKRIFLVILILGFVYACDRKSKPQLLYLAHNMPQSHPVHMGILEMQKSLERRSNGSLRIKVFSDGQLGSEREVLELLQIGSIAITKVSAATLSNFVPEYHVLGIPFLFRDERHKFGILEGEIGKSILEKGNKYWLRGLCFYDAGSRSFYTSSKAIRSPEDLKGMKIRVMNNQMSINMVQALGGTGTPMAFSELYTALQQGVVDGAENNPPSFVESNHFEVCKYYILDEHSDVPDVLVISTKYWNRLSEQEKDWLLEASLESAKVQKKYWRESVERSMKVAVENGVEVIIPDKSAFAQKSASVKENFKKDYPELEQLVNQIESE